MITRKNNFYFFAFLEGATVMAVELLSAQMLAPYYGTSLNTWGAVIGITLISLSLGYLLGGIIADKYTHQNVLYWVILFASIFILLMPFVSKSLSISFENINNIIAVLLISIILIFPALMLLGMVPILIIRILTKKVEISGNVTGTVYTISTLGGIFSLLIMGFYIIPEIGLSFPSHIIGLILGIITFFLLLFNGKKVVLIYLPVVIFSLSSFKEKKIHSDIRVVYQSEGIMGQILVADIKRNFNDKQSVNERILFVNRMGQTYINLKTGKSQWSYVDYLTSVASILPENSDALLLGLGGGTVAKQLQGFLKFNVDAVELDERITSVADKYFFLNNNIHTISDDARHYLQSTEKTYDLIVFDVFKGEVPPAHVLSLECFEKAKSKLNKQGFIIVNFNGFLNNDAGKAGRALFKTLKAAGFEVKILPTYEEEKYRNNLFIAIPKISANKIASENKINFNNVRIKLGIKGSQVNIEDLFIDERKINIEDAIIFVDDKPILENYNIKAAKIWREEYHQTFTQMFIEKGVPLFK
ncbi:MAG: fused MFS/spermidine synthase [Bacteroidia bacterium]|nr:fused MFS/spermidine synthase [Bacteroidia bacterium]